jgi:hypothetical protein
MFGRLAYYQKTAVFLPQAAHEGRNWMGIRVPQQCVELKRKQGKIPQENAELALLQYPW